MRPLFSNCSHTHCRTEFGIHRPLLGAEGITWEKWRVVVRRRASLGPKMSKDFHEERASGKKDESPQNTANFNRVNRSALELTLVRGCDHNRSIVDPIRAGFICLCQWLSN